MCRKAAAEGQIGPHFAVEAPHTPHSSRQLGSFGSIITAQ
jgi:hypothetical protein